MHMWLIHRLAVVILGAFLALSMSVSFTQAALLSQPMQMTMTLQMDMSEQSGCDACDAGGPMRGCFIMCGVSSIGLPGELTLAVLTASSARSPLLQAALLRGITSAPIPMPPRTTYIG